MLPMLGMAKQDIYKIAFASGKIYFILKLSYYKNIRKYFCYFYF